MSIPDNLSKTRCEITKAIMKMKPMSRDLCLVCKGGRMLCGLSSCPLLKKIRIQRPVKEKLSDKIFGPSPSIFIGWKGYPDVFIGPLTSLDEEKTEISDNPSRWYGADFDEIIQIRSSLVRSKRIQNIRSISGFVEKSQEIALSKKPVDVETRFKKRPTYNISFSPISQPMGPSGIIEDFRIAENPRIPKKVDSVVNDELKAKDMTFTLYRNNFDVYYLTNALSSGALGLSENRKLVPTRWSITAVDDIVAKELLKEIRTYSLINEFLVFSNQYLENHFEILLMPGKWEFELFEAWAPKTLWTMSYSKPVIQVEYEGFKGRTRYAEKEGGGYYAGRIGITEYLYKIKRQARVIIFREIHEGYIMPVGVWEVRENVRNALKKKPNKFNSLDEALQDINSRLTIPIGHYMKMSEILKQRRLTDYF
ncbi:MAG TPA: hypothetical protein EYP86_04465 [Candidatus Altiarchaeales archaeon]|nr:hypothetical protein [Candidatus Altiarchaeales archaeon]